MERLSEHMAGRIIRVTREQERPPYKVIVELSSGEILELTVNYPNSANACDGCLCYNTNHHEVCELCSDIQKTLLVNGWIPIFSEIRVVQEETIETGISEPTFSISDLREGICELFCDEEEKLKNKCWLKNNFCLLCKVLEKKRKEGN